MKLKVLAQFDGKLILEKRGIGNGGLRRYLASRVKMRSDKYVPFEGGNLKNAVHIASDGSTLTYVMPYAHYQYHGMVMAGRAPKHYTGQALKYQPMEGQYKLWDDVAEVSATSVSSMIESQQKQAQYWTNYKSNIDTLLAYSDQLPGLAEMVASFGDGSAESVNAIAGMAQSLAEGDTAALVLNENEFYVDDLDSDLILNGVDKTFLINGENAANRVSWTDFPFLVPGENQIVIRVDGTPISNRSASVRYTPTYL